MILDASAAESLSVSFSSLQRAHFFSRADLQCRHNELQASLQRLAEFFSNLAWRAYNSENALRSSKSQQALAASRWTSSGYVSGSLGTLLNGKKLKAEGVLKYQAGEANAVKETKHLFASASASLLPVCVKGSTSAVLKNKEGEFEPKVNLSAQAGAAVAHGQVNAGMHFGAQNASLQGSGQFMVAYGKAEAVFEPEEIALEAEAGAAAVRGECAVVAELFGKRITVSLSGSVGSAEAGFSFKHSTKEWSMGCKLGFIVGAGLNVKVEKIY